MKKAHGIMCHHFQDGKKHIVSQGSISAETFDDMINYYGKSHNIIGAEEFVHKSKTNSLKEEDVCLTFDDGLLCQYDIAFPVMKDRGITAFWFVYTSPLDGVHEKLEIYRHFRFSMFPNIEEFYYAFFKAVAEKENYAMEVIETFDPDEYLKDYPFYTTNDKRFRYMRDHILGENKYYRIMDEMLEIYKYDIERNSKLLWLSSKNIKELYENGNVIGLHSYSHPTVMENRNYSEQEAEYTMNKRQLEEIIGEKVISVSYPSNSYNTDTLKCMRKLGIEIGFRANMADVCIEELKYEYPREDHANIIKEMGIKR